MNILFLNTTYLCGGAERVTNQIFDGMRSLGHQVYEIISYHKKSEALKPGMSVLYANAPLLALNRFLTNNHDNASLTIPYSRRKILKFIKEKKIDLVHLHNAHGNFLGIQDIQAIADVCPIIWTIHDFWPITGHCASPSGCEDRWIQGCTACPMLQNYPPLRKDIASQLWAHKQSAFSHPNIHFTVPSRWMMQQIKKSYLKDSHCVYIPNALDTSLWIPYDKKALRKKYQLPSGKHVLAFVASDPLNPQKGMHLLLNALKELPDPENYHLLIAGQKSMLAEIEKCKFSFQHFGYLSELKKMNEFYALADILVNPSLYETFGLVNIESMASGTPVICFDICAMPEIVIPDCGWCIEPQNTNLLAKTIRHAFTPGFPLQKMGRAARERVAEFYSESAMLAAYNALYSKVVT